MSSGRDADSERASQRISPDARGCVAGHNAGAHQFCGPHRVTRGLVRRELFTRGDSSLPVPSLHPTVGSLRVRAFHRNVIRRGYCVHVKSKWKATNRSRSSAGDAGRAIQIRLFVLMSLRTVDCASCSRTRESEAHDDLSPRRDLSRPPTLGSPHCNNVDFHAHGVVVCGCQLSTALGH